MWLSGEDAGASIPLTPGVARDRAGGDGTGAVRRPLDRAPPRVARRRHGRHDAPQPARRAPTDHDRRDRSRRTGAGLARIAPHHRFGRAAARRHPAQCWDDGHRSSRRRRSVAPPGDSRATCRARVPAHGDRRPAARSADLADRLGPAAHRARDRGRGRPRHRPAPTDVLPLRSDGRARRCGHVGGGAVRGDPRTAPREPLGACATGGVRLRAAPAAAARPRSPRGDRSHAARRAANDRPDGFRHLGRAGDGSRGVRRLHRSGRHVVDAARHRCHGGHAAGSARPDRFRRPTRCRADPRRRCPRARSWRSPAATVRAPSHDR